MFSNLPVANSKPECFILRALQRFVFDGLDRSVHIIFCRWSHLWSNAQLFQYICSHLWGSVVHATFRFLRSGAQNTRRASYMLSSDYALMLISWIAVCQLQTLPSTQLMRRSFSRASLIQKCDSRVFANPSDVYIFNLEGVICEEDGKVQY